MDFQEILDLLNLTGLPASKNPFQSFRALGQVGPAFKFFQVFGAFQNFGKKTPTQPY